MWRICHSDRRTGAAARRIARETDRRPVAPPKSVEGDRVISSLYLRRAVSAGDRDSTNDLAAAGYLRYSLWTHKLYGKWNEQKRNRRHPRQPVRQTQKHPPAHHPTP